MLGDGCLYATRGTHYHNKQPAASYRIELQVIDHEFATAFAQALAHTLKRPERRKPLVMGTQPKPTNPSPVLRVSVASKSFGEWWFARRNDPEAVWPFIERHPAAFLRGLYDSEGSLSYRSKGHGRYPGRRTVGSYTVRIFSQRRTTLELAARALAVLGMNATIRVFRKAGTVVQLPTGPTVSGSDLLVLCPTPARRFLAEVGSSIPRKNGQP